MEKQNLLCYYVFFRNLRKFMQTVRLLFSEAIFQPLNPNYTKGFKTAATITAIFLGIFSLGTCFLIHNLWQSKKIQPVISSSLNSEQTKTHRIGTISLYSEAQEPSSEWLEVGDCSIDNQRYLLYRDNTSQSIHAVFVPENQDFPKLSSPFKSENIIEVTEETRLTPEFKLICIKQFEVKLFDFGIKETTPINDIKKAIALKIGRNEMNFELYSKGKMLDDDKILKDYSIQNSDNIFLLFRSR